MAIDKPVVDWSDNCAGLSAAVGPLAVHHGLLDPLKIPANGGCTVKIWQADIGKTIIAMCPSPIKRFRKPVTRTYGTTFPLAEIQIEFVDPANDSGSMYSTGNLVDALEIPGIGVFKVTLIRAEIPTVFINANAADQAAKRDPHDTKALTNDERRLPPNVTGLAG